MGDIDFQPFHFDDDDQFVNEWGSRCGVVVVCPSAAQKFSCGFFETILRGVFDISEAMAEDMLVLRKTLLFTFLEMWGDGRSHKFRTCAWGLPEFQRYVQGSSKFNLEVFIKDWLGETAHAVRVLRFMLEVFAMAFKTQIGVVALSHRLQPVLSIYGPLRGARIYIAWNGRSDHRQKFFYFEQG